MLASSSTFRSLTAQKLQKFATANSTTHLLRRPGHHLNNNSATGSKASFTAENRAATSSQMRELPRVILNQQPSNANFDYSGGSALAAAGTPEKPRRQISLQNQFSRARRSTMSASGFRRRRIEATAAVETSTPLQISYHRLRSLKQNENMA